MFTDEDEPDIDLELNKLGFYNYVRSFNISRNKLSDLNYENEWQWWQENIDKDKTHFENVRKILYQNDLFYYNLTQIQNCFYQYINDFFVKNGLLDKYSVTEIDAFLLEKSGIYNFVYAKVKEYEEDLISENYKDLFEKEYVDYNEETGRYYEKKHKYRLYAYENYISKNINSRLKIYEYYKLLLSKVYGANAFDYILNYHCLIYSEFNRYVELDYSENKLLLYSDRYDPYNLRYALILETLNKNHIDLDSISDWIQENGYKHFFDLIYSIYGHQKLFFSRNYINGKGCLDYIYLYELRDYGKFFDAIRIGESEDYYTCKKVADSYINEKLGLKKSYKLFYKWFEKAYNLFVKTDGIHPSDVEDHNESFDSCVQKKIDLDANDVCFIIKYAGLFLFDDEVSREVRNANNIEKDINRFWDILQHIPGIYENYNRLIRKEKNIPEYLVKDFQDEPTEESFRRIIMYLTIPLDLQVNCTACNHIVIGDVTDYRLRYFGKHLVYNYDEVKKYCKFLEKKGFEKNLIDEYYHPVTDLDYYLLALFMTLPYDKGIIQNP